VHFLSKVYFKFKEEKIKIFMRTCTGILAECMGDLENLRSLESATKSPVKFINRTDFDIELFWLNFSGERVSHGVLQAAPSRLSVKAMNTYVTHPWIAIDCENQRRLWLNSKEVFYPPEPRTARVAIGPDREQIRVKRANIFITKPGELCVLPT
jgi:hypothetical protein